MLYRQCPRYFGPDYFLLMFGAKLVLFSSTCVSFLSIFIVFVLPNISISSSFLLVVLLCSLHFAAGKKPQALFKLWFLGQPLKKITSVAIK